MHENGKQQSRSRIAALAAGLVSGIPDLVRSALAGINQFRAEAPAPAFPRIRFRSRSHLRPDLYTHNPAGTKLAKKVGRLTARHPVGTHDRLFSRHR